MNGTVQTETNGMQASSDLLREVFSNFDPKKLAKELEGIIERTIAAYPDPPKEEEVHVCGLCGQELKIEHDGYGVCTNNECGCINYKDMNGIYHSVI
jgi:hypothetical protein